MKALIFAGHANATNFHICQKRFLLLKSQPVYFSTTIYLAEVVVVSYRQPVHTTSALLNAYTGGGGHDETDDDYDKDDADTDYDTDDDVILVMMKKEEDAFCIFLDNGWWQIVCPDVHNTSELFNAYNDGDTDDVKGGHNDDDSGVYDAEN